MTLIAFAVAITAASAVSQAEPPADEHAAAEPTAVEQVSAAKAGETHEAGALVTGQDSGVRLWYVAPVHDGTLLVVEMEGGAGCPEPAVQWHGKSFPTYAVGEHRQALLPIALGRSGAEQLLVDCGARQAAFTVVVTQGSYPETRLSVDPKFTRKPPPRVRSERATIRRALRTVTQGRLWSRSFIRPTSSPVTSPFGVQRTFNGKLRSRHRGIDLDGKVGDPLVAANDGVVVLAADDYYYTGGTVFIDHGDRLFTLYFHMSRVDVAEGERVRRGQVIGALGESGRVTGPHVHVAVKLAGTYVSPEDLWAYEPGLLLSESLIARP